MFPSHYSHVRMCTLSGAEISSAVCLPSAQHIRALLLDVTLIHTHFFCKSRLLSESHQDPDKQKSHLEKEEGGRKNNPPRKTRVSEESDLCH